MDKFSGQEFEKFLEKYELNRVKDDIKDRILTIIVASLGLIAALAWDDALKHLFEIIFRGHDSLVAQLVYALAMTGIAAAVSVYLVKRKDK